MDEQQNVAAEAPAPEVVPEIQAETPATEDDLLSDAFDKAMAEDEPVVLEEPEPEPEEVPEEQPEPVEAPSHVPGELKDIWADIPEGARDRLSQSYQELGQKVSEAARDKKALGPLLGAVQQASQVVPAIRDMTPDQIAHHFTALFRASQEIEQNPVEGIRRLAQQNNVDLRELVGQQPQQGGQAQRDAQEIHQLKRQVQWLYGQMQQQPEQVQDILQQNQAQAEVEAFASTNEHWKAVEQHIPAFIPIVQAKLGANVSHKALLEGAYQMAVEQFVPNARAKQEVAGDEPAPAKDPERAKAVLKATSVNLHGKPGKAKPMTEDEALAAAFDRAMER